MWTRSICTPPVAGPSSAVEHRRLSDGRNAVEADSLRFSSKRRRASDETRTETETPKTHRDRGRAQEALALLKRPDLLDQVVQDIDTLGYRRRGSEQTTSLLSRHLEKARRPSIRGHPLPERGRQERSHRGHRTSLPTRRRRPSHPAHSSKSLLRGRRLSRPKARHHRGAIRLDGGRLLDPSPTEPKEAHCRGSHQRPTDGKHADPGLHGGSPSRFHRSDHGFFSVNHENATRCFELTMDESVEQTQRIHERQRLMRTEAGLGLRRKAEAIVKRHWNVQRLLGASSRRHSFRRLN